MSKKDKDNSVHTLKGLKIGSSATIKKVGGEGALRQHFLDMGLIPGTEIKVVKYAPMGDPMEVKLRGYELTLRLDDADKIEITDIPSAHEIDYTICTGRLIRDSVKAVNIMRREAVIRSLRGPGLLLLLKAIRTAVRRLSLISSPVRISMWAISRV